MGCRACEVESRCAVDGNERGFCLGDCGGCYADSCGNGFVWKTRTLCGTARMSTAMLREAAGGVTLAVRAQPGAKKTVIVGVYGEGDAAQLKIAVQAPPVEGRANEALIAFLAETLNLPKKSVELVSGELSRSKVFLLRGVN